MSYQYAFVGSLHKSKYSFDAWPRTI